MLRTTLLLMLAVTVAACQGEDSDTGGEDDGTTTYQEPSYEDPCMACDPGKYAVDCGYLWGLGEYTVCGLGQNNAEYLCLAGWASVIKASPSDNCESPSDPWDPAPHIYLDPSSGLTVIEVELLDRIEDRPQDIYLDDTRLDWNDAGDVFVSTSGQLASALGLRVGDVLLDVNGYAVIEILDTVRLYATLRAARTLELHIERNGKPMTLTYRIR